MYFIPTVLFRETNRSKAIFKFLLTHYFQNNSYSDQFYCSETTLDFCINIVVDVNEVPEEQASTSRAIPLNQEPMQSKFAGTALHNSMQLHLYLYVAVLDFSWLWLFI